MNKPEELQKLVDFLEEKILHLRMAKVTETDALAIFKVEKQIEAAEAERDSIKQEIENQNTSATKIKTQHIQSKRKLPLNLGFFLGASVISIALVALSEWQNSQLIFNISETPTQPVVVSNSRNNFSFKTASTEVLTTYAKKQLSQGNIETGLKAVEELLNRSALSNAETALENLDQEQINNPYLNFVKGRLAWQFIQKGDTRYTIDDARRYWELAAHNAPGSFLYKNALGFAYYAEGNLNRANDSWFKAMELSFRMTVKSTDADKDTLTVYAGLALSLYQLSQNMPSESKTQYLREAINLRQKVMKDNSEKFKKDSLAQDWLWTKKAIKDWQSLLN